MAYLRFVPEDIVDKETSVLLSNGTVGTGWLFVCPFGGKLLLEHSDFMIDADCNARFADKRCKQCCKVVDKYASDVVDDAMIELSVEGICPYMSKTF